MPINPVCQDPDESYVGNPANMRPNQCTKAFGDPITELVIFPAAQTMALQGRLQKKPLVPNLSVAAAVWYFPNELQVQVTPFEFFFTSLA